MQKGHKSKTHGCKVITEEPCEYNVEMKVTAVKRVFRQLGVDKTF